MFKKIFFLFLLQTQFAGADNKVEDVRQICNLLTNEDVKSIQGNSISSRKDQLLIHAHSLCEEVEYLDLEHHGDSPQVQKNLFDLNLILSSWMNKYEIESGVSFIDIIKMGFYHDTSPWRLKFKKTAIKESALAVEDSIFWQSPKVSRGQIFDDQALSMKINPDFKFAILDRLEAKGSSPKIHIINIENEDRWLMKWGDEVHADPVASRIFAALGFNVDHSYYVGSGKITLILGLHETKRKRTVKDLVRFIYNAYGTNLSPFILKTGKINNSFLKEHAEYRDFKGQYFVQFRSAAIEARPKDELRLGGMMTDWPENAKRCELRGALLAHLWVGSWDTKESNTLLSIWLKDLNTTQLVGSYSDIGTSLGVRISKFPRDLKAGLVNEFSWDLIEKNGDEIQFLSRMNSFSKSFQEATYEDLHWMALQIAEIDEPMLVNILTHSGWPHYIQKLYFYKLAERRRQILEAFDIPDAHTISIDKNYSYQENNQWLVKDGELVAEPTLEVYPEGLLNNYGRFRGFGW